MRTCVCVQACLSLTCGVGYLWHVLREWLAQTRLEWQHGRDLFSHYLRSLRSQTAKRAGGRTGGQAGTEHQGSGRAGAESTRTGCTLVGWSG